MQFYTLFGEHDESAVCRRGIASIGDWNMDRRYIQFQGASAILARADARSFVGRSDTLKVLAKYEGFLEPWRALQTLRRWHALPGLDRDTPPRAADIGPTRPGLKRR